MIVSLCERSRQQVEAILDLTQGSRLRLVSTPRERRASAYVPGTAGARLFSHTEWLLEYEEAPQAPRRECQAFDEVGNAIFVSLGVISQGCPPLEAISRTASVRLKELDDPWPEGYWGYLNRRRVFLIEKDCRPGLRQSERTELSRLQEQMESYLAAIAPLPFEGLEELERRIEEAFPDERRRGNV